MASNPGEWYAERAAEAERLRAELAGAEKVLEAARGVVTRLRHALVLAEYVGD